MLTIAARSPDHGMLAPWRFVIVDEDQRDELGALLHRALEEEEPLASAAHYAKERDFAHYRGRLIVLLSAPIADHKIPVWEQHLSCGAAGMNLLHAAHAMGYSAGWVTGWRAYSPRVRNAFCSAGERIAGFIFVGDAAVAPAERARPELGAVVRKWTPPG